AIRQIIRCQRKWQRRSRSPTATSASATDIAATTAADIATACTAATAAACTAAADIGAAPAILLIRCTDADSVVWIQLRQAPGRGGYRIGCGLCHQNRIGRPSAHRYGRE